MTRVFCTVCVCVSCQSSTAWCLITAVCVCCVVLCCVVLCCVVCGGGVDEHQCPVKKLNLPNPLHQAQRRWARHVLAEHPGVFLSYHTHTNILCASCWCRLWTIHIKTHGNIIYLRNIIRALVQLYWMFRWWLRRDPPPHDCKALWVYSNTQKTLYKCIIHSFIHHSFIQENGALIQL